MGKLLDETGLAKHIEIEKATFVSKTDVDSAPTSGSTNLVTSGGVKDYVDTQVGDIATLLATI